MGAKCIAITNLDTTAQADGLIGIQFLATILAKPIFYLTKKYILL